MIYHHFGNKQDLWKFAKTSITHKQADFIVKLCKENLENLTLKKLIYRIITLRFEAYDKNPDLVRMINWQMLEPEASTLLGTISFNRNILMNAIKAMQTKKLITHRYPAKVILTFLIQQINPSLFSYDDFNAKDKQDYLKMTTQIALENLTPQQEER